MNQIEMTEEMKARAFWGADYERVMAARQGTQKSTITAEDIAVFEAERKRLAKEERAKYTAAHPMRRGRFGSYGRHFGTCWECGCEGWLDADDYCGC